MIARWHRTGEFFHPPNAIRAGRVILIGASRGLEIVKQAEAQVASVAVMLMLRGKVGLPVRLCG